MHGRAGDRLLGNHQGGLDCEVKFTYRTGPSEAELERRRQHEEFVERTERENRRLMQEAHDALYRTDR